jgi:3-hydroxyisobutyrate dehydrogenase
MLCAVHTVATAEAILLAKQSKLDLNKFFEGIRASAGNSYVFETEAPLMFNGTFDPNFTIDLHVKDILLGREIAKRGDSKLEYIEILNKATEIY